MLKLCLAVRDHAPAQVFVLDPLLEEDGVTGDQYGPYDPAFVASERERLRDDKVRTCSGAPIPAVGAVHDA